MRKFNFLLGAAGGLFGGMLLSNKKFREKLRNAEDPSEAAKIIGTEMQKTGKDALQDAQKFMKRPEVQAWLKKMKKKAGKQYKSLQEEAEVIAADAAKIAQKKMKEAKKAVEKRFS